jgi:hypothetical protein
MIDRDALYIDQLLSGIRSIKNFKPQFGQGRAVSQDEFQVLYSADPLYRWIGFDSPLMYAAHRAGGAMTSLYRHLGAGCEHLFQAVLRDSLGLTPDQIKWQYVVSTEDVQTFAGTAEPTLHAEDIAEIAGTAEDREEGEVPRKGKRNSLDGRIDLADVKDHVAHDRVATWLAQLQQRQSLTWEPMGSVFEVRQGYKSMDAKRQAADIANAAQALGRQRVPVLVIFSNQIDDNLIRRYGLSGWLILRGIVEGKAKDDPLLSTYAFMEQVVGYDLAGFFDRNTATIRHEVTTVLDTLLTTAT